MLPQAAACARALTDGPAERPARPSDVVLAEQRGVSALLVMKVGTALIECMIVDPGSSPTVMVVADSSDVPGAPLANGQAAIETSGSVGSVDSRYWYSSVVGRVGPSVTGVDVVLATGRTIRATTRSGWWAAWWPVPEGGGAGAVSIVVHTASGTTTYPRDQLSS